MLDTYVVEGGIGKCVSFTALIPKLAEKAGQPIQIYTPYLDVFAFNPLVEMAYEQSLPLTDPRIMASDNIFYCEPYKSNFVFGKQHLIESYCEHFGVDYDATMRPKLYTDHLHERATKWLKANEIEGPYMFVQFTGGQTPINWQPGNGYASHTPSRNYPAYLGQQVVDKIKAARPELTIIDFSLPNEPTYEGTIKWGEHWAVAHEALKDAEGFVGIDSSLQHFSASANTTGVVLWGSTRWTQFGYPENANLHYHMGADWDEAKFHEADPRNIMVDADAVVDSYLNL